MPTLTDDGRQFAHVHRSKVFGYESDVGPHTKPAQAYLVCSHHLDQISSESLGGEKILFGPLENVMWTWHGTCAYHGLRLDTVPVF